MKAPPPPADLLDRPAPEAARRLALLDLEQARRARAALAAGEDDEALHDFRVAIRRLRSRLRSLGDLLDDAARPRPLRRLRKLARATNPGRDAEVGLDWLNRLVIDPTAAERRAVERLARRLGERRDRAYEAARREVATRFDRLERKLAARLIHFRIELAADGGLATPTLRGRLATEIAEHRRTLFAALSTARESGAARDLHRARIEGKRLRYLFEPLAGSAPVAATALIELKRLQDVLGDVNDLRVLADEVANEAAELERAAIATAAAGRSLGRLHRDRSGLVALAARIGRERKARSAAIEGDWLAADGAGAIRVNQALDELEREIAVPDKGSGGAG